MSREKVRNSVCRGGLGEVTQNEYPTETGTLHRTRRRDPEVPDVTPAGHTTTGHWDVPRPVCESSETLGTQV